MTKILKIVWIDENNGWICFGTSAEQNIRPLTAYLEELPKHTVSDLDGSKNEQEVLS